MRMCPLRSLARCWVRRARCASSSVRTGTPAEERGRSFGVRERTIGMQLGAVPYDVLKANGGGTPEKFHPNLATPIQRCGLWVQIFTRIPAVGIEGSGPKTATCDSHAKASSAGGQGSPIRRRRGHLGSGEPTDHGRRVE